MEHKEKGRYSYVIEYLEKLLEEENEKKLRIEDSLNENKIELYKIKNKIKLLEEEQDEVSEIFSPIDNRLLQNNEIEKYRELDKNLSKTEEYFNKKYLEKENKITEIEEVIDSFKSDMNHLYKSIEDERKYNSMGNLRILETREFEKLRISRDLHDCVIQNLTSHIHKNEFIKKLMDIDKDRCKLEFELINKSLRETIQNIREIIYNLRPMSFDDIGMKETLEKVLSEFEMEFGVRIERKNIEKNEKNIEEINPTIFLSLIRIIQEACSNAIKHAEAELINLEFDFVGSEIRLKIEDDGKGFNIEDLNNNIHDDKSGFGIPIMKERVFLLSGDFKMESKIGKGTKIYIKIPNL